MCSGATQPTVSSRPTSRRARRPRRVGLTPRRRAAGDRRRPVAGRRGCRRGRCTRRRSDARFATPCCGSARAKSIDVRLAPVPDGPGALYFVLAAVGTFTLLVGGAVRLRRPRDPATLHFFWLAVAFFGVFTFSFSGRLDRLDWVFYWADAISMLALPPLFLHFTLVFPSGRAAGRRRIGADASSCWPCTCRRSCSASPAIVAVARSASDAASFVDVDGDARSPRVPLSGAVLHRRAWSALTRALVAGQHDHRPAAAALDRLGHGARRRAVRARLRAAVRARRRAVAADGAVRDSAQPDSAGVRVGDRPLPAAGHRGDRQARAGLRGRARGDRRDLRRAARGRRARVPRGQRRQSVGDRVPRDAGRRAAGAAGEDVRAERARSRVLSRSLRLSPRARRLRARSQQRSRSEPPGRTPGLARRRDAAGRSHGADARGRSRRRTSARCAPRASATAHPPALPKRSAYRRAAGRRPHRGARRSDGRRPLRGRGDRVLARRRALLLRALRREGGHDRGAGARPQGHGRAARAARTWRCWPPSPARSPPRSRTRGSTASCTSRRVELDRLRAFNENILESLDDGLLVVDLERPHRALEHARSSSSYGVSQRRGDRAARWTTSSTRRSSRRFAPRGATRRRARRCRASRCTAAAPAPATR